MTDNYGCGTGPDGETLPCASSCGHGLIAGMCSQCERNKLDVLAAVEQNRNGAGVPRAKLSHKGTGAAMHRERYKINVRRQTAIAQAFKRAGLDWQTDLAIAIKSSDSRTITPSERNRAKERISLWLKLLPYLVTGGRAPSLNVGGRRKGRASKAALKALEALERKDRQ